MLKTTTPATVQSTTPQITADVLAQFVATHPNLDEGRYVRAVELIHNGHVERTCWPSVWLVRSRTNPNGSYRVQNNLCNCPDASQRDARHCQHALAVQLYNLAERVEAEAGIDADVAIDYELTPLALELLAGEYVDLPLLCHRCHVEPSLPSHVDHWGRACVLAEMGMDPDAA